MRYMAADCGTEFAIMMGYPCTPRWQDVRSVPTWLAEVLSDEDDNKYYFRYVEEVFFIRL